jgi:hypothetical protein
MNRYTLYLCEEGRIAEVAEMSCDDDASAVRQAEDRYDGRAMVLWRGDRNVASWTRQDRTIAATSERVA